jgi:alkylation response protein AidB-like acyl-CoA dehydrogenase
MNSFALTDEQGQLAENLARLLRETQPFEAKHRRTAGSGRMHTTLWSAFAELGVIGSAFNEASGGFAGDARTIAVVMAELGSALAFEPFVETAVVAGRILQHWTEDDARRTAIDAIINGSSIVVVAHSPSGEPAAYKLVTATKSNGGVLLSGKVPCVRHAQLARSFLVPAVDGDGITRIFHVPGDSSGLTVETYRLIDGADGADLHFNQTATPMTANVSLSLDPQAVLDDAREWGIVASVAEMAGIMEALNTATFTYMTTRKQFGRPIGSFQALQHRAADMYIAAEETLAIAGTAIDALANGPSPARSALVSAARVIADSAARRIGAESVQLHGGMGVSDELIVSHYARRLLAIRHGLGNPDSHRLRFRSLQ